MGSRQKKIIVCGIGNLLLQDEGVGVHVVRELKKGTLPSSVEVLEAGTSLLDFLADLQEADQLLLIDAMKADGPPGSIYLLDARELTQRAAAHPLSLHQVGALDILRIMALEGDPPPCLVIGIEPASLEWGLEPSPLIRARMPEILRAVREQIERLLSESQPDSD
ncbi:MAG: HyaD/HybD family hydrogenase maturation endopeptidase [candidate division NC10 bacterium]|nr:HyaD/HybD family hydrogenase maturation endopeptidase [candidate division NC10 bacterium]